MTLTFAFNSDVGTGSGSRLQCLLGHVCTSRHVAAVVAGEERTQTECDRIHCLLLASSAVRRLAGSRVGGYL